MLKKENIKNGQLIIVNKKGLGIIRNVRNAGQSGLHDKKSDPEELGYDIFYPKNNDRDLNICEHSNITSEAIIVTNKEAGIYLKKIITENNLTIADKKKKLTVENSMFIADMEDQNLRINAFLRRIS